jgi:hypothetical protein
MCQITKAAVSQRSVNYTGSDARLLPAHLPLVLTRHFKSPRVLANVLSTGSMMIQISIGKAQRGVA